jgi:hypothetical protein
MSPVQLSTCYAIKKQSISSILRVFTHPPRVYAPLFRVPTHIFSRSRKALVGIATSHYCVFTHPLSSLARLVLTRQSLAETIGPITSPETMASQNPPHGSLPTSSESPPRVRPSQVVHGSQEICHRSRDHQLLDTGTPRWALRYPRTSSRTPGLRAGNEGDRSSVHNDSPRMAGLRRSQHPYRRVEVKKKNVTTTLFERATFRTPTLESIRRLAKY